MPKGAEGGLPNGTAPKQEAKPLSKSALQEEGSEIQQLVNDRKDMSRILVALELWRGVRNCEEFQKFASLVP